MNIKITKLLLPFFPDTNFLRKYWWHRLGIVIGVFFSVCFSLIGILSLYLFITASNFSTQHPSSDLEVVQSNIGQTISDTEMSNMPDFIPDSEVDKYFGKEQPKDQSGNKYPVGTTLSEDQFNKLYPGATSFDPIKEGATPVNEATNIIWFYLETAIIFLVIVYTVPNGFYRLILFIAVNNKWRQ